MKGVLKMTMTIEQVIENLKGIKEVDIAELQNEIIIAFEDYEFEGITEIIVSSPDVMNGFSPRNGTHSCYIDHTDSQIIKFELEEVEEGVFSVLDVWEA